MYCIIIVINVVVTEDFGMGKDGICLFVILSAGKKNTQIKLAYYTSSVS